jgi:hypothetical protein
MKIGKFTIRIDPAEKNWRLEPATCGQVHNDNAAEMVALLDVIEDLRQQNRELHDRLLAVYAPVVAQTLPAMPSFQVDYKSPVEAVVATGNTLPVELPGTQVGDGE